MARKRRSTRRRKGGARLVFRLVALAVLAAIIAAAWFWWSMREWRPSEQEYPEQGAVIASGAGPTKFETIKALGGDFAYLALGAHSAEPDEAFAARLKSAQDAGLEVGVVYPFDPCQRADPQSARFTRMVPRDAGLLPPAIVLLRVADGCDPAVSDAAVESELMILVNQIERHAGKPSILKLGEAFEARHGTARSLDRDLWLMRERVRPDYAPRPWLLWSANSQLVSDASEEPIEWVVVQK
ncbi:MAG: glycoside hydrolase family 25 protein [Pseudomonadota bacterium]